MAYLPLMIDLKNKDCLIIGGGKVAFRKAQKLLGGECRLSIVASKVCDELKQLSDAVAIYERPYSATDLEGKYLVVAATNDSGLNSEIAKVCEAKNILVNVVAGDEPGSVQFPATIEKGNLVVGVSTKGSSPAGAAYLKNILAQAIPNNYEQNLEALEQLRAVIRERVPNSEARRKLYYNLLEYAVEGEKLLTEADIQEKLSEM